MADIIRMDPDVVIDMGSRLGTAAQIIQVMDIAFMGISTLLIATGFGAAIGSKYIGKYHNIVVEIHKKCDELEGDLKQSAEAYRNGDAQGATKFH